MTETDLTLQLNRNFDNDINNRLIKDPAVKLSFLNLARIDVVNLLNFHYLTEISPFDLNRTVTSGKMALSVLDNTVALGGDGVIKVRVTGGKWAELLDIDTIEETDNVMAKASTLNPKWYIQANSIYMRPTSISAIDVYYIRKIDDLTTGATDILNDNLKDLIVLIAEERCRIQNKDLARAAEIRDLWSLQIKTLNAKYTKVR